MIRGNGPKYPHDWIYDIEIVRSQISKVAELSRSPCALQDINSSGHLDGVREDWVTLTQEASSETPSAALDQMMGAQETSLLSLSMQL